MDQTLRHKLEAALATQISKSLDEEEIDEETSEDAAYDFLELLDGYNDERSFINGFGDFLYKYSFARSVGDYYVSCIKQEQSQYDIEQIRQQLQSFSTHNG